MAKQRQNLTSQEQKTTAAFKLITDSNKVLKRSLKKTQDELERYREKYYLADKNHAVQLGKNSTLALHEILKFIISTVCGGIGVNYVTQGQILIGLLIIILGVGLYVVIVFFDKN